MNIALTAQQFGELGKAWVENVSLVLNTGIAQFGILAIAAIGVWKSIHTKAELKETIETTKQELSKRLDTQSKRINDVAIAAVPTNGNGGGTTVIDHPEQVEITP